MNEPQRCFLVVIQLMCQVGNRLDVANTSRVVTFDFGIPKDPDTWTTALENIARKCGNDKVKANVISIAELPR